ncbi:universal stress protein [Paenarthrobacter sp. DKR-5]|uniref:universal stress protein n=1 Tax=Paenarthrobacter sp. DKR-5 TaxID=2835535 RepID=UPI001BDC74D2|nr:universal stress protein [Paenarthrobacter sp. DKR-5]MBT1002537.1 universal stress protein [Paenarthrobacter sp. DKR-5]
MSEVVLVAVNDSRAAFRAAEVAVDYARRLGARLRVVTVQDPAALVKHPGAIDPATLARHTGLAADAAHSHVAALAAGAGVEASFVQRSGRVAAEILAEARAVEASLIVIALVDRPGAATPYIGSHTLRVLEFSSVPVLVVPIREP